jgi:hypothetical protein
MNVYADLLFDAIDPEGESNRFSIVARFRDKDQMDFISTNYIFDDIISDIEEILPFGYVIDSEIEFGDVYERYIHDYDIDLSWIEYPM